MLKISWFDTQTVTDCITFTEWNNMTTYIQHSACTDFTIYSTCPSTGAVFKFGASNDIEFDGDRAIMIDDDETYIGHGAGDAITDGIQNTLIGNKAGTALTGGDYNTAVGYIALEKITTGSYNTAVGNDALGESNGGSNSALGCFALQIASTANNNTAVGYSALAITTTGAENVAIGSFAGSAAALDIANNVYVGFNSGQNNTQGNIVAIGHSALQNNTGLANIALGYQAMDAAVTGSYNIALGYTALGANLAGAQNVAVGYETLFANTTGNDNVAIGFQAGRNDTNSNYTVCIGSEAGEDNTQDSIVGIGYRALTNNTGLLNTAVGYLAMDAAVTGSYNTALGSQALGAVLGGASNVAIGHEAIFTTTTGGSNVVIGFVAGRDMLVGTENTTLIGTSTGRRNQANFVVGVGSEALIDNTGLGSVAVGYHALDAACTGNYNTTLGYETLTNNTSGANNVSVGYQALLDNVSGAENVAVGSLAGENALVSGCVYLGYDAGSDNGTANRLFIDNSNTTDPLILGEFDNGVVDIHNVLRMEKRNADYTPPNNHGSIFVSDGTGTGDDGDLIYAYTSGVGATTTIIIGNIA